MKWQLVIGLEVHVQLLTQSKIFSDSPTHFGQTANSQASIVDLGFPGTLPVLNKEAVQQAILFGLAANSEINRCSIFERKNYFYPDLPKGYQLSQFQSPIIIGGTIPAPLLSNPDNSVQLTRAHLEEDAGKSVHTMSNSGVDLNRAGIPLLEIVTEPCIHSIEEAISYLKQLHLLVQYLGICDGNMQEGSFRCDVNLSVKQKGQTQLGVRTEIKNVNSFKFIEKAISYEMARHIEILEQGGTIKQETRLYNEQKQITRSMRSKEEANDYRYFPCPDLLPVIITDEMIKEASLPELPSTRREKYLTMGLTANDIERLINNKALGDFYDSLLLNAQYLDKQYVCNWVLAEVTGLLNKRQQSIQDIHLPPSECIDLLMAIYNKKITANSGKQVLEILVNANKTVQQIINELNLELTSDQTEIDHLVANIIKENPKQVEQYLAGKTKLLGFFVGQVMKKAQGKLDPAIVNQSVQKALKKE